MSRALPAIALIALLAAGAAATHPGSVLVSQAYEYYVGGASEAVIAGVDPVCHVATYRGDPVSVGGACLDVPAAATEVVVRIQGGGLEATYAYYEFRDADDVSLGSGWLCGSALRPVPSDAVRLVVAPHPFAVTSDCPDPRPALAGYVGADFYAPS